MISHKGGAVKEITIPRRTAAGVKEDRESYEGVNEFKGDPCDIKPTDCSNVWKKWPQVRSRYENEPGLRCFYGPGAFYFSTDANPFDGQCTEEQRSNRGRGGRQNPGRNNADQEPAGETEEPRPSRSSRPRRRPSQRDRF